MAILMFTNNNNNINKWKLVMLLFYLGFYSPYFDCHVILPDLASGRKKHCVSTLVMDVKET